MTVIDGYNTCVVLHSRHAIHLSSPLPRRLQPKLTSPRPSTPQPLNRFAAISPSPSSSENAHKAMTQMLRTTRATSAPYYGLFLGRHEHRRTRNRSGHSKYSCLPEILFSGRHGCHDRVLQDAFRTTIAGGTAIYRIGRGRHPARCRVGPAGMKVALKPKDEIDALTKKSQPATPATTPPASSRTNHRHQPK